MDGIAFPTTRTTCPYCGVGCGVLATPMPDGSVAIAGDPDHPANFGRLCSKGTALGETLSLDDRLLFPEIAGQRVEWNEALDLVAKTFSAAIRDHGPDSVALYVSGQLLTEDYYVANKLMKGYVGSANIDTNSRLCMASSVAGHRRAFGTDTVPGTYSDLESADLVVLVGSNFAWCHPVLFQRLLVAREKRGTRVIVVDPRRTMTAEAADLHLAIAPDQDLPLFLGLLRHLSDSGLADGDYLARFVGDPAPALAVAAEYPLPRVAEETGLDAGQIAQFYREFSETRKVVTVYSQGINQSVSGSDKVNAIINCHLLTGRIGQPGMGPFSITGQPNAMGGREVGGLANMLAAHMDIENAAHRALVKDFWQSPTMAPKPGLKAVDLFQALEQGRIKALWIMATNPADSLPDADLVQRAMEKAPFVVVSDAIRETDTTRFADVLLPALAWGEKDGTVTNSERRISRQRGFLPHPGEARPDWWALKEVAGRMGFAGFDYPHAAAIFAEHAALSGYRNDGQRDFDISRHADIDAQGFDALPPFQWPATKAADSGVETRFFAQGGFFTPDRRARMLPTPARAAVKATDDRFNLWLNTGRVRDQWHTMTRTGKAARLMGQYAEPYCEIHPDDAANHAILPGALVRIETAKGHAILRAQLSEAQRQGSVFVPMHWTDQYANRARINACTWPLVDPASGQPGLKAAPARIEPFRVIWSGFAVTAQRPEAGNVAYWALAKAENGYVTELAGTEAIPDWAAYAKTLFSAPDDAEWVSYFDAPLGIVRLACFAGEKLIGALFVSCTELAVYRGFLAEALGESWQGMARLRLLAGRSGADRPDPGPMVCACFAVGLNQIVEAIHSSAGQTVETIGAALKAGTNCGSCRSDIRRLIDEHRLEKTG
jgi:assimilatory nitrate reductase catalytic subunit